MNADHEPSASAHRARTFDRQRIVRVWQENPDVTASDLAERFGANCNAIGHLLRAAFAAGETTRNPARVKQPTRTRRPGRL